MLHGHKLLHRLLQPPSLSSADEKYSPLRQPPPLSWSLQFISPTSGSYYIKRHTHWPMPDNALGATHVLLEKTAWISGEYCPLGGWPQSLVQLFTDGGASGMFRFGKCTNRTAILFHGQVFVQTHLLSSLNTWVKNCRASLVLEQRPLCFLGWLYHVAFP